MNTIELIFQQAGLKTTHSRSEVVSVLTKNNYPLTHSDLLKQLPENFDRVHFVQSFRLAIKAQYHS